MTTPITAGTDLRVRMITSDDKGQARTARRILTSAERVVVPLSSVVEFVWEGVYDFSPRQVVEAVRALIAGELA